MDLKVNVFVTRSGESWWWGGSLAAAVLSCLRGMAGYRSIGRRSTSLSTVRSFPYWTWGECRPFKNEAVLGERARRMRGMEE
jgi:hypothetical protein